MAPTRGSEQGGEKDAGGGLEDGNASDGIKYTLGGDEHGILHNVPAGMLPPGSTVQLMPSHCDPTVNLHDYYVCVRRKAGADAGADAAGAKEEEPAVTVERIWRIDARGPAI